MFTAWDKNFKEVVSGHVGFGPVYKVLPLQQIQKVDILQVDGHELEEVMNQFPNISLPNNNSLVIQFFGDKAREIISNIIW